MSTGLKTMSATGDDLFRIKTADTGLQEKYVYNISTVLAELDNMKHLEQNGDASKLAGGNNSNWMEKQKQFDVKIGFPLGALFMDCLQQTKTDNFDDFINENEWLSAQQEHNPILTETLRHYATEFRKSVYSPLRSKDIIDYFFAGNPNKMIRYIIELYRELQHQQKQSLNTFIDLNVRFVHEIINKSTDNKSSSNWKPLQQNLRYSGWSAQDIDGFINFCEENQFDMSDMPDVITDEKDSYIYNFFSESTTLQEDEKDIKFNELLNALKNDDDEDDEKNVEYDDDDELRFVDYKKALEKYKDSVCADRVAFLLRNFLKKYPIERGLEYVQIEVIVCLNNDGDRIHIFKPENNNIAKEAYNIATVVKLQNASGSIVEDDDLTLNAQDIGLSTISFQSNPELNHCSLHLLVGNSTKSNCGLCGSRIFLSNLVNKLGTFFEDGEVDDLTQFKIDSLLKPIFKPDRVHQRFAPKLGVSVDSNDEYIEPAKPSKKHVQLNKSRASEKLLIKVIDKDSPQKPLVDDIEQLRQQLNYERSISQQYHQLNATLLHDLTTSLLTNRQQMLSPPAVTPPIATPTAMIPPVIPTAFIPMITAIAPIVDTPFTPPTPTALTVTSPATATADISITTESSSNCIPLSPHNGNNLNSINEEDEIKLEEVPAFKRPLNRNAEAYVPPNTNNTSLKPPIYNISTSIPPPPPIKSTPFIPENTNKAQGNIFMHLLKTPELYHLCREQTHFLIDKSAVNIKIDEKKVKMYQNANSGHTVTTGTQRKEEKKNDEYRATLMKLMELVKGNKNFNILFSYFKENTGMQINDGALNIFDVNHSAQKQIILINSDLHFISNGKIIYLVAGKNDPRFKAKWKIIGFMSEDEIYSEYGITRNQLPKSSRRGIKLLDPNTIVPLSIINNIKYKDIHRKTTHKKPKSQNINKNLFVESCRAGWNEFSWLLPCMVVKDGQHWVEYKKFIKRKHSNQYFAVSLEYDENNNKFAIMCIDYNRERTYYQHVLVGQDIRNMGDIPVMID
eukprot:425377_1